MVGLVVRCEETLCFGPSRLSAQDLTGGWTLGLWTLHVPQTLGAGHKGCGLSMSHRHWGLDTWVVNSLCPTDMTGDWT